jgi:hypothetical protein
MTCQECELALAGEERSPVVDGRVEAHMAGCAACREFAVELRENSEALRAFAMEPVPVGLGRTRAVHGPAPSNKAAWWMGVAAALVLGFASLWIATRMPMGRSPRVPGVTVSQQTAAGSSAKSNAVSDQTPAQLRAATAARHRATRRSRPGSSQKSLPQENSEPRILQVKMLTDDPDVVIYWQIEN